MCEVNRNASHVRWGGALLGTTHSVAVALAWKILATISFHGRDRTHVCEGSDIHVVLTFPPSGSRDSDMQYKFQVPWSCLMHRVLGEGRQVRK